MKILLVNPPDTHRAVIPGLANIQIEEHAHAPPLGIMHIKSYIEKTTDNEIRLFNFQMPDSPTLSDFKDFLGKFKPEIVGITVNSIFWFDACQTAKAVRKALPETIVVAGGPHVRIYPGETLSRDEFDIVVVGEGEITFRKLVERIQTGRDMEGLSGLWYKTDKGLISNPPRPVERDPDVFPFPDRSDFEISQHRVSADRLWPAAVILTSRGCPYQCTFCQNNDRLYRTRRTDLIVDEILECKQIGYRSVDFYDDNFSLSRKHVESLCREMIDREVNMPWVCRCRVDHVDRDLMRLMASAGCERIHFGVESASQHLLDRIRKGITVEQSINAIAIAKEAGISTLAYFILGFPGETMDDAKKTVSLAFKLEPDYAMFLPLMPLPCTTLYNEAIKDPNFGNDYAREFALDPVPHFKIKIWPTAMTEEEIINLVRKASFKFYFRPKYIARSVTRLSGIEDFISKINTALRILFN